MCLEQSEGAKERGIGNERTERGQRGRAVILFQENWEATGDILMVLT